MKIENLCKSYGDKTVLRDLTLELPDTGVTVLSGASGCGKTTLLRLLAGLETPDSGTLPPLGRVSYLFQEDRLFPHLTAKENVALVADGDGLLASLGLEDSADKFPHELSGGMKRRVALARALAYDADTYLFDEPFKGLDAAMKETALALLLRKTDGKRVILVTHEPEEFNTVPAFFVRM